MRRKDSNYNFLFYMRVENTMELKKLLIIILYMYKLNKKNIIFVMLIFDSKSVMCIFDTYTYTHI